MGLTVAREHQYASDIQNLEAQAWDCLVGVSNIVQIREELTDNKLTTRQKSLHSLEETIEHLLQQPDLAKADRTSARRAKNYLKQASGLRWEMVLEVEPLIRKEAHRFARINFVSYEDLLQEGYIGALNAARRFEPNRKVRFTTYARWWIRAQITRCLEYQGRLVRLPGGAVELIRNIRRLIAEQERQGEKADLNQVAAELDISRERLDELLEYQGSVSVDQEKSNGESYVMELADESQRVDPEVRILTQSCMDVCYDRIPHLDDRQRYIIEHHFGLHGQTPASMSQIGRDLGLSRERVRQLKKLAFKRLAAHL